MNTTTPATQLVIGVGNPFRGDDGVGPFVARLVREQVAPTCVVTEASGEGTALMSLWEGVPHVILIDAVRSGAQPGEVLRIDAATQRVPSDLFHYSTHAFSVAEAIETARALGSLPPSVTIFGIVAASFAHGQTLTPAVAAAGRNVAAEIVETLTV